MSAETSPEGVHPEWAAVGNTIRVLRKFRYTDDRIVSEHNAVVVRHTPTLIITDSGERFRLLRLVPQYLNYVTYIVPEATS